MHICIYSKNFLEHTQILIFVNKYKIFLIPYKYNNE